MFRRNRVRSAEAEAMVTALDKSQAVIEFNTDGTIITANENFLSTVGYTLSEVQGKHHSLFVDAAYRESDEYRVFWERLRRGEYQAAQYCRVGKGGKEIWIEASYNPILGRNGKPYKVVKFATDITSQKTEFSGLSGVANAIGKSQAMIEFDLTGRILAANQNFIDVMGYSLAEIQGQHHGMFVEDNYRVSEDYRHFWAKLSRGEFEAGQFKRFAKDGREVWLEASYNPILDPKGKPYKVVKFATDISKHVELLAHLKKLIDENFSEIDVAIAHSTTQARETVGAVGHASGNFQTIASSSEELAASIREIAHTMERTNSATDMAHTQTAAADQATQRLADAAKSMGGIVGLIANIASQINLLALNATIESARAGAAGRGFAVVASEVKSLAKQASEATDQISKEIDSMQVISHEVVTALGIIGQSISTVRDYVTGTAGAVQEQSAVTQNISSTMQAAVGAIMTIKSNAGEISNGVQQVAEMVEKTKTAARVLAR